jgi:hypothetical protein
MTPPERADRSQSDDPGIKPFVTFSDIFSDIFSGKKPENSIHFNELATLRPIDPTPIPGLV